MALKGLQFQLLIYSEAAFTKKNLLTIAFNGNLTKLNRNINGNKSM